MQVHLDAMKDTHLHLACKGVATLTETIQEQAQKISFLEEKLERLQNCPFIWKISNFSSVMAAAQRNELRVIVNRSIHRVRATNLSWNCTLMATIPMTTLIRKKGILCQSTSGFWSESMTDFFYGHFKTR